MPAHSRKDLVREGEVAVYHVWSRCVQSIYLCGVDPITGKDFSHRKNWVENLLKYQSKVFAVDVGGYHTMSNHKHADLCTRPDIAATWSDEEVAWRWKMAWPKFEKGEWFREPEDAKIAALLAQGPEVIEQIRQNLSSLSWFMARWKQPIALEANKETKTKGHMWAERFGCRELTNDGEILSGLVYTDLQQIKCGAARTLEESDHSSIQLRLKAWASQQAKEVVDAFEKRGEQEGEYDLSADQVEQMLLDSWMMPFSDQSPLLMMRNDDEDDELEDRSTILNIDGKPLEREASTEEVSDRGANGDAERPAQADAPGGASETAGGVRAASEVVADRVSTESADESSSKVKSSARSGASGSAGESDASSSVAPDESSVSSSKPKTGGGRVNKARTYEIHQFQLPKLKQRPRLPVLEMTREKYFELVRRAAEEWLAAVGAEPIVDAQCPPRASPQATPSTWSASFKQFFTFFEGFAVRHGLGALFSDATARGDPD